ncbi:MAG: hypothetical protein ACRDF4_10385, partial [Rhabdochlamydiaceae bacterium]
PLAPHASALAKLRYTQIDIGPLSKFHSPIKMAVFSIFKTCLKTCHFFKQSEFRKRSNIYLGVAQLG